MDVVYRPTEGAPIEGGTPLARPDVPISEGQREPRVTLAERIERSRPVPVSEIRAKTRKRQDAAPIVELDFKENARSDGSMDLRTASRALSAEHAKVHSKNVTDFMGVDSDQLSDEAKQRIGEDLNSAGRKPGEAKRVKLGQADHEYNPLPSFREKESPLKQMRERGESPKNVREVTDAQTRWRDLNDAQEKLNQQALLNEVRGQLQAGATSEELVDPNFQGVEQSEQTAQPQRPVQQTQRPQQPPVGQPQAPDPLAAERAQLQAEYNRAAAYREHAQMSAQERQYEEAVQKLDQWARGQPELMDHNLFQNLVYRAQRGDIASANKLKQFQKAFDAKKAYVQKFVETNTARVNRQIALEQRQAAQNAQVAEAQRAHHNKTFDTWLEQTHPTYARGDNNRALKNAAKEILRERGYSDEAIKQLRPTALEQSVLADAAILRIGRARVKEIQRQPLPPVQTPGVARSRYADVEGDIKSLQRKVSNSKGRAALWASVELTRAQRRARGD